MLPLMRSRTSRSVGCGTSVKLGLTWLGIPERISSSTATAEQICPGVQKPHWKPSCLTKAACIGCSLSGVPRPSMVVILSPSCMMARLRQELIRRPLTMMVQAPHWPWSHPFFVPVRCRCSLRASSSVVRGSSSNSRRAPLTSKPTFETGMSGAEAGSAATAGAQPSAATVTPLMTNGASGDFEIFGEVHEAPSFPAHLSDSPLAPLRAPSRRRPKARTEQHGCALKDGAWTRE